MPTNVAEIFLKGTSDNTLILETRCQLVYPFDAPGWMDLRVGFFLSVCSTSADDPPSPITGLSESIPVPPGRGGLLAQDLFWAGIKSNNDSLPYASQVGFIGFSNSGGNNPGLFPSDLVSSDGGIGTTNNNFWRPRTLLRNNIDGPNALIIDGVSRPAALFNNVQQHFAQVWDGTSAHPYATLLMLRIVRPTSSSRNLTVTIKQGTNSGDVLFTNTPTSDLLETNLSAYPTVVQSANIPDMHNIPDSIYLYWPFHQSRLRCHALGFMKFA